MRLTQTKIEEIVLTILGEDGLSLVKELYGKENISEFTLATKTKKDIKIIRKMLYLLYNHNLVGFIRKKDKDKGWYIYYWTFLPDNIRFIYFKRRREMLEKLKQKLEEEKKELFFGCPNKCVRLNFDNAMDLDFHCPECGELLGQDNSPERITFLENKIKEVETELEEFKVVRKEQKFKVKERRKAVRAKIKIAKKKKSSSKKIIKNKTIKKKNKK